MAYKHVHTLVSNPANSDPQLMVLILPHWSWQYPHELHPSEAIRLPLGTVSLKVPEKQSWLFVLLSSVSFLCQERLKRLLPWHSGKEGKVKWAPLPSFEAIQSNQAVPGHSWTTEEIPSHSLDGRGWYTDHSPHWKQLLPQPMEYPYIIHASFWHSGQRWNSLLWSLIQCESHVLKQKWNVWTFNTQPLIYRAYCRYHSWAILFLKYKTCSYICPLI